jgi:hypothetical protein
MCYICVPHPPRNPLQTIGDTKIQRLNTPTSPTHYVMVVMLTRIELVPIHPIAKIAPPHQVQFLKSRQRSVNRYQITSLATNPPMQLLRAEGTVSRHQKVEQSTTLIRHPHPARTHHLKRLPPQTVHRLVLMTSTTIFTHGLGHHASRHQNMRTGRSQAR